MLITTEPTDPQFDATLFHRMREAIASGMADTLQACLTPDMSSIMTDPLVIMAAEHGRAECLRVLLPHLHAKFPETAVRTTAQQGHLDCLQMLIAARQPMEYQKEAVSQAAMYGHVACLRALLRSGMPLPVNELQRPITQAAMRGHGACVNALLPWHDPASYPYGLYLAALTGHQGCVDILAPCSDVQEAWDRLTREQNWDGLDCLASYVPDGEWDDILTLAPSGSMPRTAALRLASELDAMLPVQVAGSSKKQVGRI